MAVKYNHSQRKLSASIFKPHIFLMTPTPKITAVLATCIGAAWIGEQLCTILKQKDKTVGLLVSINLSLNNTKKICFEYSNKQAKNIIFPVYCKYGSVGKFSFKLVFDVDLSVYFRHLMGCFDGV